MNLTPYQLNILAKRLGGNGHGFKSSVDRLKYTLENTPKSTLKPTLVFTFDDGYAQDYDTYLTFKSYGVVGSSFIVKEFYENGYIAKNENWTHLTFEQMEEMYEGGWEFGSHGYRHISMGISSITEPAIVGATKVYTNQAHRYRTNNGVDAVLDHEGNSEEIRISDYGTDSSGDYVSLESPLKSTWEMGTQIKLTDEELYKEVVWSKDFVESLGFSCRTLAYPYNSHRHLSRLWASRHYFGARSVGQYTRGLFDEGYGKTENIGINLPYPLNTYALWAHGGDGVSRGNATIKDILDETVSKNGLAIIVAHSGIPSFNLDGIAYMIEEAQSRGIEITTLDKAMHRFGNIKEYGDWLAIRRDNELDEGNIDRFFEVIPTQYQE